MNHDAAPLDAAIGLLEFQRETWQLTCDKLRAEAVPAVRAPHMSLDAPTPSGSSLSLQG